MERFEKLFNESPIPIFIIDYSEIQKFINNLPSGEKGNLSTYLEKHPQIVTDCLNLLKVPDVNTAFLDLMEAKDRDELIVNSKKVVSGEILAVFKKFLVSIAEGTTGLKQEAVIYTLKDKLKHVIVELRNSDTTSFSSAVFIIDITENVKARKELRKQDEQIKSLFHTMGEGLIFIEPSGQIVLANPMAESILGLSKSEIELRNYINPEWKILRLDGSSMPPEEMAGPRAMKTKKPVKNVVMGVVRPDNTIRWINVNASPVTNEAGEFGGVVGTFADISEKIEKENEVRINKEKLDALFQAIPIPAYTWQKKDDDFVLVDFNHAAELITQGKVKKYIGATANKIHRDDPEILNEIKECYQKKTNIQREMSYDYKEIGEVKFLAVKYSYVPPDLVVMYTEDITEQKNFELELKKTNEQLKGLAAYLQTAREEERAFIGREIHDQLGQILTTLKMDLFLLGLKIPKAETEKRRLALSYEIKSMLKNIDQLIQTAHNLVAKLKPGNLDILDLQAAIELHTSDFLRSTGIKFKIRSNIKKIDLDKKQALAVFRIFEECLTNVVRHAEATRVDIRLQQKPDHLFLTVKDNGNGLAGDKISGAESFGLIGMRERALSLGGDLAIDSAVGKGTSVTLRIPSHGKKDSN